MEYKPYDYQNIATEFAVRTPKGIIMLDAGTGKSVIALKALWLLKYDKFEDGKIIIIADKYNAEHVWTEELKKWDFLHNFTWSLVTGNVKEKSRAIKQKVDIYITNYDAVQWIVESGYWDYEIAVIDELSAYKSEKTNRFKALHMVADSLKRMICLSSLPIPNNLKDLWAQIYLIDNGKRLGEVKRDFLDRYFYLEYNRDGKLYVSGVKPESYEMIHSTISDITIRSSEIKAYKKNDCITRVKYAYLGPMEYSKYRWLENEMHLGLHDYEIDAKSLTSLNTKLLQIANGSIYDENKKVHVIHNKKIQVLDTLIKEFSGKNIMVVVWFNHDAESIINRYPNAKIIENEQDIKLWNDGKVNIAIMNPATGGKNIELQSGGSIVIWYSLTWSLRLYKNMNNRFLGKDQKEQVVIEHIVSKNTIDERIMSALSNKDITQEKLLAEVHRRSLDNER